MAGHVRMTRPDMSVIVKQDLPVETVSMVGVLIKEYNYYVFIIVMCLLRAHLWKVNNIHHCNKMKNKYITLSEQFQNNTPL